LPEGLGRKYCCPHLKRLNVKYNKEIGGKVFVD
jgi:hypothetical protein